MRESRLNLSVVIFAGLLLFIICETAISLGIVLTVTAPVRWLLVPTSTYYYAVFVSCCVLARNPV